MKPEQALQVLNQATATIKTTREVHVQIQNALSVFANLIELTKEKTKSKK